MQEKDLINLEYDKFLKLLSEFTSNKQTKEYIKSIRPIKDAKYLEEEINKTWEFIKILKEEGFFPLSEFPDINDSINLLSIHDSVLFPKDIYEIGLVLRVVKEIKSFLNNKDLLHLKVLFKELYPLKELETLIFDSIDKSFSVKDSASYDLYKIRRGIKELENKINSVLEKIINNKDYEDFLQERFVTIKRDRFVIPVKYNFASRIKGIIQDKSSTGQTVFIEPLEVVNLNNQLLDLKLQESIEIRKILKFITDTLRSKVEFIKKSYRAVLEFDMLYAKGKYAVKLNAIFPEVSDRIYLKNAYHPIFLLNSREFKPINIDFSDKRGLLITGSNTGGKTVALKTVGLIALLNQSAIPVPVDEGSTIPIFDGVYIDIGDSQSIEENLSTFSAHILNIKRIIPALSDKSLVLFDELIPGTDPDFASSLGIAILEKVKSIGSYIVATTHLRKIKFYGINQPYFRMAAVGFDKEKLMPVYELVYDTVGESMAFYIAKKLGLDEDIVDKAVSFTEQSVMDFEEVVNSLNKVIAEYSHKVKDLEEKEKQLEEQLNKYKSLVLQLEKDKKEKWKESFKEIENFIENIRKEGYEILDKVREEKSGKPLESFIKTKRYLLSEIKEEYQTQEKFKEGDTVRIKDKKQTGQILEIKGSKAKVDFNGIKMWVKLSDIEKSEPKTIEQKVVVSVEKPKLSYEINLIGKTKEEAIRELENYLDKAVLAGIKTFKVIHGYGSGILRKAVREFLDRYPVKLKYQDAPYQEGGLGVTIVYLE